MPNQAMNGLFFSEVFGLDRSVLAEQGAFDVSLVNDLPLFIDPFLLFHSKNPQYQQLHRLMIDYLRFLRDQSATSRNDDGLLKAWYCFPEIKQNWLGFSLTGNRGSGLGLRFARELRDNLHVVFSDFGREQITAGSHIEKVCLVRDGIGRDNISDFVTNLIQNFLCRYTERLAKVHLTPQQVREVSIGRAMFNYTTQMWERRTYLLPWTNGDHVILTPRDILTRDETWINRKDLLQNFGDIPSAIPDAELRAAVMNYFWTQLSLRRPMGTTPKSDDRTEAAAATIRHYPQLVDYYIRLKEDNGDNAKTQSAERVVATEIIFSQRLRDLLLPLLVQGEFGKQPCSTYGETHARLAYLKHVIEDKGGWRIFYHEGRPIERESDLQILFRLVWFGTMSDAGSEANDGRGPVDFKISRGREKTLVEMKLASNSKLEVNLRKQLEIYKTSAGAQTGIYVIIYFTAQQRVRVEEILKKVASSKNADIVLIDARNDNKTSASAA